MKTKYKTDKLFWKYLRETNISAKGAELILTSQGDLTDVLRKRADHLLGLEFDLRMETWRYFKKLNKITDPYLVLKADPVTEQVTDIETS